MASEQRLGPVLVTPEPYYSCEGCKWLHRIIDDMGLLRYCMKGKYVEPITGRDTPSWCPLLPKGQTDD